MFAAGCVNLAIVLCSINFMNINKISVLYRIVHITILFSNHKTVTLLVTQVSMIEVKHVQCSI